MKINSTTNTVLHRAQRKYVHLFYFYLDISNFITKILKYTYRIIRSHIIYTRRGVGRDFLPPINTRNIGQGGQVNILAPSGHYLRISLQT